MKIGVHMQFNVDYINKVLASDIRRMLQIINDKSFFMLFMVPLNKTFDSVISHIEIIIREINVHDINANLKKKTKSESYGTWLIDRRCSFISFTRTYFFCRLNQNIKNTLWNATWGRIKVWDIGYKKTFTEKERGECI